LLAVQLYARKLGACLLEMTDSEACSISEDLQRWIIELTSLMVCVSLGNPKGLKAFHSSSMDGSSASVRQLPESFYEDLLVSQPSRPISDNYLVADSSIDLMLGLTLLAGCCALQLTGQACLRNRHSSI
jgi:hypothetical protein